MGADAFVVYYGVRLTVPLSDEKLVQQLEDEQHPWQVIGESVDLDVWWGQHTMDSDYHVFVGKRVGLFGGECLKQLEISGQDLQKLMIAVDAVLSRTALSQRAGLHLQFEEDF